MADLALGVVKDIVKTGMAIKEAVDTVRHNEVECQDLQLLVATTLAIMFRLQNMGLISHPEICAALMDLNGSLHRALKLVTECQKRNRMHRFLTSGDMAKQLRQVHDSIQLKMQLGILAITASTLEVTVEFTRTTIIRSDGALPPPKQQLVAGETHIHSRHTTIDDARSKEDGTITMVTTGSEAPFTPSSSNIAFSGLTGFSLSETVAARHVSENISRERHRTTTTLMMQKVVIKFGTLECDSWQKVLELVSEFDGVVSMGIAGDGRNHLDIVGGGVDFVRIVQCLRKLQYGRPEIVQVEEVRQLKPPDNRCSHTRRSGFGARIAKWLRPRAGRNAALPPPPPSPLRVEHDTDAPELAASSSTSPCPRSRSHLVIAGTPPNGHSAQLSQLHLPAVEAPAMADEDDLNFATTDPLLQQHQPASPPAAVSASLRRKRRTFNMSRVHRRVRLTSARRHISRMMMPRTQPSSPERWGARVLQLLVACAVCTLVLLLASVWALR